MRTKTVNIYKFSELSEKAKDTAIYNLADVNVGYEWWDSTYEDAERAGLKITSHDDYRIKGRLLYLAEDSIKRILADHGGSCETYKTALSFKAKFDTLAKSLKDSEDELEDSSEYQDLTEEYLQAILEDYRIILRDEYEYQTSRESIIESIEANEYEFTECGKLTR